MNNLGEDNVFDLEYDVKINHTIDSVIDREEEQMTNSEEVRKGHLLQSSHHLCIAHAKVINTCANKPEVDYDNIITLLL